MKKYFVTGIGTDVGKTVIAAILTEALEADYWKPVQAGDLAQSDSIKVKDLISNEKTIIHPEHIVKCKITPAGVNLPEDSAPPSGELEMHAKLQRYHRGTRAVVHLHPTHIIAAMYAGWDLQKLSDEFPEVSRYTRVGPSVPVLPVTSSALAAATFESMTDFSNTGTNIVKYDIVGQKNHGVCAVGPNPWDAYEHIERLEHICEIVLKSGKNPNE